MLLKNSRNSYIVGGCVRDILLDETPKDFDFVNWGKRILYLSKFWGKLWLTTNGYIII